MKPAAEMIRCAEYRVYAITPSSGAAAAHSPPGAIAARGRDASFLSAATGRRCHPEAKPKDLARVRASVGGRDASCLSMTRIETI
jgi:hypothetical protein